MKLLNSLMHFDRYLSGLKLARDEHETINLHIQKLGAEIKAAGQRGEDGT